MNENELAKDFGSYMLGVYSVPEIWLVKGSGVHAYDTKGNKYIDALAGIAVCGTGHCHPKVVGAISEQASKLMHCTNLYGIPNEVMLAKRLCSLSGFDKAFFSNSGAEANEAAIKIARKHAHSKDPDKSMIITACNSFHGRTLVTVTATGQQKYQKDFYPLPAGFAYIPFNDEEAVKNAVHNDTAALMLESIQGEGGVIPATKEYMRTAMDVCHDKDVLLILDEVQTGMGRTGRFFAYENYGIEPDIVTLAKSLGSGFPIGATLSTQDVAGSMGPGDHGSTFGGNPLACSAALSTLDVIEEEGLMQNAARMGDRFMKGLSSLSSENAKELVENVRGMGLLIGVKLNQDVALELKKNCANRGLLVGSIGNDIIRMAPPLVISSDEIDQAVKIIDESFEGLEL